MRIKIVSARVKTYWYSDRIGEIYRVVQSRRYRGKYKVVQPGFPARKHVEYYVDKRDCRKVKNKEKK